MMIVRNNIEKGTRHKSVYETYHFVNPDHKRMHEIFALLQEYGYPLQFISPYEYREKVEKEELQKDGELYRSVSTELANTHVGNMTPTAYSYADAAYTEAILKHEGILCPKIDLKLLSTYLEYCIRAGYFSSPQKTKSSV